VARKLLDERAQVVVTDPKALDNARQDLADAVGSVQFTDDPYQAARGAHAVAIMTEWELYRSLDWERIYASMDKPAFVFDGRNILDHQKLFGMGFNVFPIGSPPLKHFQ
jgi:UDPglucose 6-dehydrogenase